MPDTPTQSLAADPNLPAHLKRELFHLPAASTILNMLTTEPLRSAMARAADAGVPPATAVSGPLLDAFGPQITSHRAKRFIGAAVSWVMKGDGFEIVGQPTPVAGDRLFKTATRFRRRPVAHASTGEGAGSDLLARIVGTLDTGELFELQYLVKVAIDALPDEAYVGPGGFPDVPDVSGQPPAQPPAKPVRSNRFIGHPDDIEFIAQPRDTKPLG